MWDNIFDLPVSIEEEGLFILYNSNIINDSDINNIPKGILNVQCINYEKEHIISFKIDNETIILKVLIDADLMCYVLNSIDKENSILFETKYGAYQKLEITCNIIIKPSEKNYLADKAIEYTLNIIKKVNSLNKENIEKPTSENLATNQNQTEEFTPDKEKSNNLQLSEPHIITGQVIERNNKLYEIVFLEDYLDINYLIEDEDEKIDFRKNIENREVKKVVHAQYSSPLCKYIAEKGIESFHHVKFEENDHIVYLTNEKGFNKYNSDGSVIELYEIITPQTIANIIYKLKNLVKAKDIEQITFILKNKCSGRFIPVFRNIFNNIFNNDFNDFDYILLAEQCLKYDFKFFFLPIVESNYHFNSSENIQRFVEMVISIVKENTVKTHQFLLFVSKFKEYTTIEANNYLLQKSQNFNAPDYYKLLFDIVHYDIEQQIRLLIKNNNDVSLFYLFTIIQNNRKYILNNSKEYSMISSFVNSKNISSPLLKELLYKVFYGKYLNINHKITIDKIVKDGFTEINKILSKKKNKKNIEQSIKDIKTPVSGEIISVFKNSCYMQIKGIKICIPNHCLIVPNIEKGDTITIYSLYKYQNDICLASQFSSSLKEITRIPILKVGEEYVVSFCYNIISNKTIICEIRNVPNFIQLNVDKSRFMKGNYFKYKQKYIAVITKVIDFSHYEAKLIRTVDN